MKIYLTAITYEAKRKIQSIIDRNNLNLSNYRFNYTVDEDIFTFICIDESEHRQLLSCIEYLFAMEEIYQKPNYYWSGGTTENGDIIQIPINNEFVLNDYQIQKLTENEY